MPATPPTAARRPVQTEIHGETRIDDYHWLHDREDPAVRDYLEAENAWADRFLAPTNDLAERIFTEIKTRIQQTDISVPYRIRDWLYFSRTEQGKQYPTYYRRRVGRQSSEQAYLDLNQLAADHSFLGIGSMRVSPDGKRLAYSADTTGFRQYTLHILDLETGQRFAETMERVASVAWCTDSSTLFYVVEDDAKRPYRLYRHCLGSDPEADTLVYQEPDKRFSVEVWRTLSDTYLFLEITSHTTSDLRFIPADQPQANFRAITERKQGHEFSVTHRGEQFFIRSNDRGANFRLVTAPVATPDPSHWVEVVPHRSGVMLAGASALARFTVLTERQDGLVRLRFLTPDGADHSMALPESVYDLSSSANMSFDLDRYRYSYQSMITPPSVFDYDPLTRASTLLKETPVLGDYDRDSFVTRRITAAAEDGTAVPISLVYHRDTRIDGSAALFLTGYGSYGYHYPTHFSHARISLLQRGMVYAIAHVRGGGEMGKPWHLAGRMQHKRNTFTDFIACAEHLIDHGYAASDKLVVKGGSAGGLLLGVVANLRPQLFRLMILDVPFVDVINTMLDETLPLTVGEFEEWGNPKLAADYACIRSYCPCSNLRAQAYPAMLVKTSFHDSQVMYWEPAKYVAKLRTLKTNTTPLLLKTNMVGGHGGSSGRYDAWRETAQEYALALWLTGTRQ